MRSFIVKRHKIIYNSTSDTNNTFQKLPEPKGASLTLLLGEKKSLFFKRKNEIVSECLFFDFLSFN